MAPRAARLLNVQVTDEDLLRAFHTQIRLADRDATPGHVVERAGLVHRTYPDPPAAGAMIESPEGLGADPDAVIARERDFFAGRGHPAEWKTYSYDEPADLGPRLTAAGFARQDDEAVMLGELSALAGAEPPAGVAVRAAGSDELAAVGDLHDLVWPGTRWLTEAFAREQALTPDDLACVVAAEGDLILCAAWVRLTPGTDFAGMWGGATHPDHRRRGLYRAVLAARARWALDRGYTLARVDASPESEPILTRLGMRRVATTTPYLLRPGRTGDAPAD